jgi:hypothetical protein
MTMKLWLDDERPAPEGWLRARSVEEAIYIMGYSRFSPTKSEREFPYRENFEACSLDHDLGMGDDNDGIQFVDWMVENGIWPKTKPTVHSMNPAGRKRMERTIDRYWPR